MFVQKSYKVTEITHDLIFYSIVAARRWVECLEYLGFITLIGLLMSSRSKQIFFDAYFNLPYKKIQITFYVLSILYVRCALKVYSISRTAGSKKKRILSCNGIVKK